MRTKTRTEMPRSVGARSSSRRRTYRLNQRLAASPAPSAVEPRVLEPPGPVGEGALLVAADVALEPLGDVVVAEPHVRGVVEQELLELPVQRLPLPVVDRRPRPGQQLVHPGVRVPRRVPGLRVEAV